MTSVPMVTDEELASRAIGGDQEAFADLYERYFDKVYDLIARMTRNQADASDVAQDTFMKMLAGLGTRPPHTSFRAWLYTIARNTAIDRIRGSRHMVALQAEETDEEDRGFYQTAQASDDDPEQTAISEDLAALVWQAARGLSSNEYTLLDMNLRQGLEAEEMAEVLGTTRGNVYTMLSRLRDSFEQSFTALLLARRGRDDCPELNEILLRAEATDGGFDSITGALDTRTRRAVNRHVSRCDICTANRRRFVSAAELFGGFVPVLPGLAFREEVFAGLMEQFPAATGSAASQPPQSSASSSGAGSAQTVASASPGSAASSANAGFWASSTLLVKGLLVGGAVAAVGIVAAIASVLATGSDDATDGLREPDGISAPVSPSGSARVLSPSALFTPETYAMDANVSALSGYLQDLNADGFLDIAVGDRFDNLGIWTNQGDGAFSGPVKYPTGPAPYYVASSDLNSDGNPDIAAAYAAAGIAVHLNNGDGSFSEVAQYPAEINSPSEMAIGDFDMDGDQDIATATTNQAVVIFLNGGEGTFEEQAAIPVDGNPQSIAGEDLDGDGDLDLAVGSLNSGIWALTNDGNGSFEPALIHEERFLRVTTVDDVDGDGDIDLIGGGGTEGQTPQNRVLVLKNEGGGSFGAVEYTQDLTPLSFSGLMKTGDVDMDGDPDILLSWASAVEVFYNDGSGSFSERETVGREGLLPGLSGGQSWLLDVGDVDNDSDYDIVISVTDPERIVVLRNNAIRSSSGAAVTVNLVVDGDGWVNVTPPGERCSPDETCILELAEGTELTIYTDFPATPGSGARFDRWDGDCRSLDSNPYPSLTVSEDMECIARFTR